MKKTVLSKNADGIKVEGRRGTWYVIREKTIEGEKLFLLESEQYGDEAACLIVNEYAEFVLDDVWNGFADYDTQLAYMKHVEDFYKY